MRAMAAIVMTRGLAVNQTGRVLRRAAAVRRAPHGVAAQAAICQSFTSESTFPKSHKDSSLNQLGTRPITALARAPYVIRPEASVGSRARIRAWSRARSSDAIAASPGPTLGPPRMVVQ